MKLVSLNDILARPEAISTRCSLRCTSDIVTGGKFKVGGKKSPPSFERYLVPVLESDSEKLRVSIYENSVPIPLMLINFL